MVAAELRPGTRPQPQPAGAAQFALSRRGGHRAGVAAGRAAGARGLAHQHAGPRLHAPERARGLRDAQLPRRHRLDPARGPERGLAQPTGGRTPGHRQGAVQHLQLLGSGFRHRAVHLPADLRVHEVGARPGVDRARGCGIDPWRRQVPDHGAGDAAAGAALDRGRGDPDLSRGDRTLRNAGADRDSRASTSRRRRSSRSSSIRCRWSARRPSRCRSCC